MARADDNGKVTVQHRTDVCDRESDSALTKEHRHDKSAVLATSPHKTGRVPDAHYYPQPGGAGLYQSAVIGGYEADGTSLYLCGAYVYPLSGLHYIPGRLRPGLGGCSVGLNGTEMIYPNYVVLAETYTTSISVH